MWHTAFTYMTFSLPPATTPCVRTAEVSKYNPQFTHYACAQAVILTESLPYWNLDPSVMHQAYMKWLWAGFFPHFFPRQETSAVSCSQYLHPFDYRVRYVIFTNNKVCDGHWYSETICATSKGSAEGIQITTSWSLGSFYVEQGRSYWYQTHTRTVPHRTRQRAKHLNYLQNQQFSILALKIWGDVGMRSPTVRQSCLLCLRDGSCSNPQSKLPSLMLKVRVDKHANAVALEDVCYEAVNFY